jgi:signal transduction histidine kinase
MPDSSPASHIWREAGFDQMCHDLKNPLMVIRGRAQLIERAILRSTALPEAERTHVLHSLAAIEAAVLDMVEMIDDANPSHLVGGSGRMASRIGPHSS